MRRHLVLVRHAKSAWDQPAARDHDRSLNDRGRDSLPLMLDHLASSSCRPDLVWCSSARRTIETLAGVRSALPDDVEIEVDRDVYHANAATIVDRLRELADGIECAMVVGHNPTMQHVTLLLADARDSDAEAYQRVQAKYPTGAIATISFDGNWNDLDAGGGRLDDLFTPRRLR